MTSSQSWYPCSALHLNPSLRSPKLPHLQLPEIESGEASVFPAYLMGVKPSFWSGHAAHTANAEPAPPTHPPTHPRHPPGPCHQKQEDCRVSLWRVQKSCPDTWRHSDLLPILFLPPHGPVFEEGAPVGIPKPHPPPQTYCSTFADFSHEGCENSLLLGLYQSATARVQNHCGGYLLVCLLVC